MQNILFHFREDGERKDIDLRDAKKYLLDKYFDGADNADDFVEGDKETTVAYLCVKALEMTLND